MEDPLGDNRAGWLKPARQGRESYSLENQRPSRPGLPEAEAGGPKVEKMWKVVPQCGKISGGGAKWKMWIVSTLDGLL